MIAAPPTPLAHRLSPCGPVLDAKAAERVRRALDSAGVWSGVFDAAWPTLESVFGVAPYLASLASRGPQALARILNDDPEARLAALLEDATEAEGELDAVKAALRRGKAELHLLTALCDLGGVWGLDQVTGALTLFADLALGTALRIAAHDEAERGRLISPATLERGAVPGFFCLALGKHGAYELNYSSDIDISIFYEPDRLPVAPGVEPQALALRLTQTLAAVMQERTADGYVFRVDLRLRPDPSSTPAAMPVEAALDYYESVGQNWERAAMIKARPAAGDLIAGAAFVEELQPFVWRRHLDYAAIADIQSIKQQIHVHRNLPGEGDRLTAAGANLKLGPGGIREIEFFAQTQQLISGGRDPTLRSPRTLDALKALTAGGQVAPKVEAELARAYADLRGLEHRVQMLHDEQTHTLPTAVAERRRVAALAGFADLRRFDAQVLAILRRVNARYGELFAEAEPLSSRFGSLVFTGVDDDPETLTTLAKMGFSNPAQVSALIRSWHHGRIAATRTERARALFTRLAPRLLEAAQATGAPDAAFNRFRRLLLWAEFRGSGPVASARRTQVLFELLVEVMAFAPRLAITLARRTGSLSTPCWTRGFFDADGGERRLARVGGRASREPPRTTGDGLRGGHGRRPPRPPRPGFPHRRAGDGRNQPTQRRRGAPTPRLADACIRALAAAVAGRGGADRRWVPRRRWRWSRSARQGSREMTARSDLDLMTLYRADGPDGDVGGRRGGGRRLSTLAFTQRLTHRAIQPPPPRVSSMRWTCKPPSVWVGGACGSQPRGVRALLCRRGRDLGIPRPDPRAGGVGESSAGFADAARAAIDNLRFATTPREPTKLSPSDVREMRALMAKEKPPPVTAFGTSSSAKAGWWTSSSRPRQLQIAHASTDDASSLRDQHWRGAGTRWRREAT